MKGLQFRKEDNVHSMFFLEIDKMLTTLYFTVLSQPIDKTVLCSCERDTELSSPVKVNFCIAARNASFSFYKDIILFTTVNI